MLLSDDNVRILIFTIVLLVYMVIGAYLFRTIESNAVEIRSKSNLSDLFADFNSRFGCNIRAIDYREIFERFSPLYTSRNGYRLGRSNAVELATVLLAYSDENKTIATEWDLARSFYFVGSIITTVGYGNVTPQTKPGKALVIVYGFFGCAGGILYFNLCLERNITFWAYVLRRLHQRASTGRRRCRRVARIDPYTRQSQQPSSPSSSPYASSTSESDRCRRLDWKPNVYWVLVALTCSSATVLCTSALHYSRTENWTFFEAFYFAFVSFTTIGFGDYVVTQHNHSICTKIANFVILIFGCSCLYSLLNVTSIVIKRFLNLVVRFVKNGRQPPSKTVKMPRLGSEQAASRSKIAHRAKKTTVFHSNVMNRSLADDVETTKPSDILTINQIFQSENFPTVADNGRRHHQPQIVQQKRHRYRKRNQLWPRQQRQQNYKFFHEHNFIPALVGSLAIVSEKICTAN